MIRWTPRAGMTYVYRKPVIALVSLLLLAGCGGEGSNGSEGGSSGSAAAAKVEIEEFKFTPEAIEVKAGGTVTFSSRDKAMHNAQTDPGGKGAFTTADLERGDEDEVTFKDPGRYSYYCAYHRFMTGTVEVTE